MVRRLSYFIVYILVLLSPTLNAWGQQTHAQYFSFEERWVFSYLLASVGEPSAVQQSYYRLLFQKLKAQAVRPTEVIQVDNFEQFLKAFRGEWPNSESLQRDLEILEKVGLRAPPEFKASAEATPGLQKQIAQFLERHNEYLRDTIDERMALNFGFQDLLDPELLKLLMERQKAGEFSMKNSLLVGAERVSTYACEVLQKDFREVSVVGKNLSGTLRGNPVFNALMSKVLGGYFEKLSLKSKKQIVSQLMGENLKANPVERFEVMVMNSGPQFQKLLQVVAREAGVGEDLLAVFKKLESRTRPVPGILVKEIVEAEMADYNLVSYNIEPLGIGTMAQVHKGEIRALDGSIEPVVIRFIKPGIEERIDEDRDILLKIAPEIDEDPVIMASGLPKLAPLVDDLTKTVRDELKMQETVERQNKGHLVYSRNKKIKIQDTKFQLEIYVPRVYDRNDNNNDNEKPTKLMVQEFAEGGKLDKVQDLVKVRYPGLKLQVVEEIAKMWMTELLFNTGFFHSDLHQGNFIVKLDNEVKTIHVNILDFGMGGELSELQRRSFLLLASGAEIEDAGMISEAIWSMSDANLNHITRPELDRLVKAKVFSDKNRISTMSSTALFAWALEQGIKFPHSVLSVNRGFSIIEAMLTDAGSELNTETLGMLVAKQNLWKLKNELRNSGAVGYFDLVKLWFASFKKSRANEVNLLMCRSVLLR